MVVEEEVAVMVADITMTVGEEVIMMVAVELSFVPCGGSGRGKREDAEVVLAVMVMAVVTVVVVVVVVVA